MTTLNTFQQASHPVLPEPSHEERSRQEFTKGLRGYLQREILPGLTPLFAKATRQAKSVGVDLESRHDVRRVMKQEPYFQAFAGFTRRTRRS